VVSIDPNLLFFGNWVDASSRIEDIEKFLEHADSAYQRELKLLDEEGHVDLDIEFVPLFAETLPPILYTSVVIAAASVLEQELRGISHALREALKLPLSFNDLSGSLIERFRKYTIGLAGLPVTLQEGEWQDILAVYEVRNCLIHAGGDLRSFPKADAIRLFSQRHQLTMCQDDRLELEKQTAKTIARIIYAFLENVYEAALVKFPGHYGSRLKIKEE
jgi:hypothetical protein